MPVAKLVPPPQSHISTTAAISAQKTRPTDGFHASKSILTSGRRANAAIIVLLPPKRTLEGKAQVKVDNTFTVIRLDDHMLYVIFIDSTIAAAAMGMTTQQVFNLAHVLSRLLIVESNPHVGNLSELIVALESLCIQEAGYWQQTKLQPLLHDRHLQRYQTYMVLFRMSIRDPRLFVFVDVCCQMEISPRRLQTPVMGKLKRPFATADVDAVFLWYEYMKNWTNHTKSIEIVKVSDMLSYSICPADSCTLPSEVILYDEES